MTITTRAKTFALPSPFNKKSLHHESEIQKNIITYLKSLPNVWHLRIEGGGKIAHVGDGAMVIPSCMAGAPDVIFVVQGEFFACEIKKTGGRVAGAQLSHLYRVKCAGGRSAIVTSVEGLKKFIAKLPHLAE